MVAGVDDFGDAAVDGVDHAAGGGGVFGWEGCGEGVVEDGVDVVAEVVDVGGVVEEALG
ncbi:Uncharacterised protein [Dermatophilus congolensis]|uniref:Uncharacterized protein n=1 Tax=Dermatophilus congolensis TaxID=1863 RepID=A0AA46H183_9MICO|nr:Uncharacterised protein [Dermatophilus congolensis]